MWYHPSKKFNLSHFINLKSSPERQTGALYCYPLHTHVEIEVIK